MTTPKEGFPMHRQALGKGLEALLGSVDTATGTLREIPLDEILPWDFIDIGTEKSYLISEFDKAKTIATKW